ncbi:MAG: hypothetical protein IT258_06690 [Saprospiraceae bacterium]|nr:hypothetical protein [Saprospiraceae bacterium]
MNLYKLTALLFTLFFMGNLLAQRQVSGTVKEAATGEPMIGVTVFLKSAPPLNWTAASNYPCRILMITYWFSAL